MKRGLVILICLLLMSAYASPILGRTESAAAQSKVLRIANLGEYMAGDEGEGTPGLLQRFEEEFDVTVEYSRFDTNERIYNDLKLNKQGNSYSYDLVCVSDYMIQKMIREGMLEKIENPDVKIPTYVENVSPYIQEVFEKTGIAEYAVGYMWGTMGFVLWGNRARCRSPALQWLCLAAYACSSGCIPCAARWHSPSQLLLGRNCACAHPRAVNQLISHRQA